MLGNYIEFNVGGKESGKRSIPMKVVGIYEKDVLLDFDDNKGDVWEIPDEDLLGIEITEEILEKCGFRYITDDEDWNKVYFYKLARVCISEHHTCVFSGATSVFVTYLHELQNAYRLLTGKDMEVKL